MKKEKSFNNFRHNGIHLNFPNGNFISTIWGVGSYTENHDFSLSGHFSTEQDSLRGDPLKGFRTFLQSDNVEVAYTCSKEIVKKIRRKFGEENPLGYLSMKDWLWLVNTLSKGKVATKIKP
jgi:hypothetical protein